MRECENRCLVNFNTCFVTVHIVVANLGEINTLEETVNNALSKVIIIIIFIII